MIQPALFEFTRDTPRVAYPLNPEVDSWAFLYTATETGNNSGIRFMLPVEQAKVWCSSPVSSGRHYSTEWAYFWTTVRHFIKHHSGDAAAYGEAEPIIDIGGLEDNGEWDERIAKLGLSKVSLREFGGILGPLGVTVVNNALTRGRGQ